MALAPTRTPPSTRKRIGFGVEGLGICVGTILVGS